MHTYTFIVFVLLVHSKFKYDVDVHIHITQEKSYDVTLKSGGIFENDFEKKKKKLKIQTTFFKMQGGRKSM